MHPQHPMAQLANMNEDQEVCSETLRVESKLFYLDLKRNARGRYLKIAEKGTNRERSTIIVPYNGIMWFRELFNYYAGGTNEQGPLVSKELPIETKSFYFETGENTRGRFLRVSESGAGPRGRSSIIIPAGGATASAWGTFRDALARIEVAGQQAEQREASSAAFEDTANSLAGLQLDEDVTAAVAGSRTVVGPGPSPPTITETDTGGQIVRAGHKRFFFDLGSNAKGKFLRITEVVGLERIALVVPAEAIRQFQSALGTCQEQHASGVVSTARVQPQLPPAHAPSNPGSISAVPPAPSTASAPCTPSHADHHNHISPQVKLRAPTPPPPPHCGVQLMEHLHPLVFQPMWILPPADGSSYPMSASPLTFNAMNQMKMHAMLGY
ncbi:hypothetical protein ABBQ32_006703 [Trebouxia sp. C0010 RCD-2024]